MSDEELRDLAGAIIINDEARDLVKDPLSLEEMDAILAFCTDESKKDLDPDLKTFYLKVIDILLNEIKKASH